MAQPNIETIKKQLIQAIQASSNLKLLEKMMVSYYEGLSGNDPHPMTWDELGGRLDKSELDFERGRVISQEDLMKEAENW